MRDNSVAVDTDFKTARPAVIAPDMLSRGFNHSFKTANETSADSSIGNTGVEKMLVGFGIMNDESNESPDGKPKSPEALRQQLLGAKTPAETKSFETDMVSALRHAHSVGGTDAAERFMQHFRTNDPFLLRGTGASLDQFGGDIRTFSPQGKPQSARFFYNPEHEQTADRAAHIIESVLKNNADPSTASGELRKMFQNSVDKLSHQGERVDLYDALMKGVSSKLQLDASRGSGEGDYLCVNGKNGERLLRLPMRLDFEKFPLSGKDLETAQKTADHIAETGRIDEAAFNLVAGRMKEGYSADRFISGVNSELARKGTLYNLELHNHDYALSEDDPGYNRNERTTVHDTKLVLRDDARPGQEKAWPVKREKTITAAPRYEKTMFTFGVNEERE